MLRTATVVVLAALGAQHADAGVIRGRVVAGAEAEGVAGVWVWFDSHSRVRTRDDGSFELETPDRAGIVWARVPDGFEPGRAWQGVAATGGEVEIALTPTRARGPLRFVHVSVSHIGKRRYGPKGFATFTGPDLARALDQALAHDPDDPPAFFVMTGDLTNRETKAEIGAAAAVLLSRGVPFIAVPGNHDWVARGANYKRTFGPPSYSFDAGGVHFVVLNDNWRKPPDMTFLARDLETVTGDRTVIALVHRPPRDQFLNQMERFGVDYLLTGHWHSNRYVDTGSLRQITTQSIVRGGIDFTPAGYRIITVEGGELAIAHGTITERPAPALTWPLSGPGIRCTAPGSLEILAAAEPRLVKEPISVEIDGAVYTLGHRRGWVHAASAGKLAPGSHSLRLDAPRSFEVCDERPSPKGGTWSQVQGGGKHGGHTRPGIEPPLVGLWATATGQHISGGSPAIGGGSVVVPLSDLDDGDGGGVVALSLETGAEIWRVVTGHSVRGTPAIAGELVVFGDASGKVHGVELVGGRERWVADLANGVDNTQSALVSAVAIDDRHAYAVVIGRIAAIDLADGAIVWEDRKIGGAANANMTSRAAPTIAGELVIATAGWGKGGLVAFDRSSGERRWKVAPKKAHGINGSPVVVGELVIVIDAFGVVRAFSRTTGVPVWKRRIAPHGNSLSLVVAATPAVSGRVLVIPTQYHSLIALDVMSGAKLWTREVARSALHTAHDDLTSPAVTSSPIIAGDVVWFGGADGVLRAASLESGELLASIDLGAPILSGPAPAGEVLAIATYDGVVRALAGVPVRERQSSWPMIAILFAVGFLGWWFAARGKGIAG